MQDKLATVSIQRPAASAATPAARTEQGGGRARGSRQRQRLIDACITALHLYGPSRTTVEKVVAIADLSPGIVRFYFDSKDAMLVASLGYLAAEFEERVLVPVSELKDSPVRALERLVDLYLDPQIASTRKISVWYSFWGEASSRQEYLDICGKKDEDFAALVRDLIERLIAETGARHLDADGVSLGLIGVLEVLWQGLAFQSEEHVDRAAARERSLAYLRSIFPGRFPAGGMSVPASVPGNAGTRLAAWTYASGPLHALEREHLLRPAWQLVGHEAELAGTGNFLTASWPWERALIVRNRDGELNALRNACRKHPHALLETRTGRIAGKLRCDVHDLTYDLDGRWLAGATPGDLTQLELARVGPLLLVRTRHSGAEVHPPEDDGWPAEWSDMLPGSVEEIAVAADWKVVVEQWLDGDFPGGFPGRHFLPPNQLLDLESGRAQILQVVPEAPGRSRLVRFELQGRRHGGRRMGSDRRHASASLREQMALAESTQRGLETLPPQAEDGARVPQALALFRRSIATLLPLLAQTQGTGI